MLWAYFSCALSIGNFRLNEVAGCEPYSDSDYFRILDLRASGAQTLATLYGRGDCELGFLTASPPADSVLGRGVGEDDLVLLRAIGSDAFVQDAGLALYVEGRASRQQTTLRFAWGFRQTYDHLCGRVRLRSGAREELTIELRGVALFRDREDETGTALRFDPYATADRDADGEVTLEELDGATLAARLYLELVPQLAQRRNAEACSANPLAFE